MRVSRRGHLPRGWSWPLSTAELRSGLGDELFDAISLVWSDSTEGGDQGREVISVSWRPDVDRYPTMFAADQNTVSLWVSCA